MRLSKLVAAAVLSAVVVTPALADSATGLSVAKAVDVKASTPAKKSNKLNGTTTVVAVLATAALIGGAIALTDGDSDSD
jgi:hypothetical protein